MKQRQIIRLSLLALTGAMAFGLAGPSARAEKEKVIIEKRAVPDRVTHRYVYYPEAEIYLVPETREYWVREGGRWHAVTELPTGVTLGSSVNLDLDRPDPWTTHEIIVKKYGGKDHKQIIKKTTKEKDDEVIIKEQIKEKDLNADDDD